MRAPERKDAPASSSGVSETPLAAKLVNLPMAPSSYGATLEAIESSSEEALQLSKRPAPTKLPREGQGPRRPRRLRHVPSRRGSSAAFSTMPVSRARLHHRVLSQYAQPANRAPGCGLGCSLPISPWIPACGRRIAHGALICFSRAQRRTSRSRRPILFPSERASELGGLKDVLLQRRLEAFAAPFRRPREARSCAGTDAPFTGWPRTPLASVFASGLQRTPLASGSSRPTTGWPRKLPTTGGDPLGRLLTFFRNARRARRRAEDARLHGYRDNPCAGAVPVDSPIPRGSCPPADPPGDEELPARPDNWGKFGGGTTWGLKRNRTGERNALKRGAKLERREKQYTSISVSGPNTPGKREEGPIPRPDLGEDPTAFSDSLVEPAFRALWLPLKTEMGRVHWDTPTDTHFLEVPTSWGYFRQSSSLPADTQRAPSAVTRKMFLRSFPYVAFQCLPLYHPAPGASA